MHDFPMPVHSETFVNSLQGVSTLKESKITPPLGPGICRPSCNLSSKHSPALNVSPLSSAPSAASPFADCFPESANMSLRGAFSQRIRGVVSGSITHTRRNKLHVFSTLSSTFLKTKVLTLEPSVQRVENRKLATNTRRGRGEGGYHQRHCVAHVPLLSNKPALAGGDSQQLTGKLPRRPGNRQSPYYSARSASTAFTRAALAAGTAEAITAAPRITTADATNATAPG